MKASGKKVYSAIWINLCPQCHYSFSQNSLNIIVQEFDISVKILQSSAYTVGDYIDSILINISPQASAKLQVWKKEVTTRPSASVSSECY